MPVKILALFSDMVARQIYPAMARIGLQRKGKRAWWEHRPDDSWVLLEIQMSKFTTRTELGFTINTLVWPPGTWAHQRDVHHSFAEEPMPYTGTGPIMKRPRHVAPELWPWPDDFREIDMTADFSAVGEEMLIFLGAALAWGRAHSDVEGALLGLNSHWAAIMLRAAAPEHSKLPSFVDAMRQA